MTPNWAGARQDLEQSVTIFLLRKALMTMMMFLCARSVDLSESLVVSSLRPSLLLP